MLSDDQLKIRDLHNIPIANVKKLMPDVFEKLWKIMKNLLETRIETKKMHRVSEFNQSQWLKPYTEFHTQKRAEAEKK